MLFRSAEYLNRTGVSKSGFVPGQIEKKPSIAKLSDLKAVPVKKAKVKKQEVQPSVAVAPVSNELTIVEVTETVAE